MRELLIFVISLLIKFSYCTYIYHPSFLNEDEINHLRSERDDKSMGMESCNEDNLINFLAEIQVINPESILKLATFDEIIPVCLKTEESLKKINDFLKKCDPPNQADLYRQLIRGVGSLHQKLCTDSVFKKKFEEIHQCLHELRNDLEDCAGPADWNENSDNDLICKAYKDIADCYYIKTAKVCGKSAAEICKEFIEAVIDSVLTISCDNIKVNPSVKNPMPDEYLKNHKSRGEIIQFSTLNTIIMIVIFYI